MHEANYFLQQGLRINVFDFYFGGTSVAQKITDQTVEPADFVFDQDGREVGEGHAEHGVRRRVLRQEETERDPAGQEIAVLYCPRRETTYRVAAVMPDDAHVAEIQEELARLLFADAG